MFSGKHADLEVLRRQPPLPETADELCAVASALGASSANVYLGRRATEGMVKDLSATGQLARARIIHFATHGLIAAETASIANEIHQSALLLTPPIGRAGELDTDDGLLTAGEISKLEMNADWVVLSACNTAGAGKGTGSAVGDLARSFFFAGARALLVSHWYVDSDSAVKIITRTFSELAANPGIGRGEAHRRAVRWLIDKGGAGAHPAYWAPFVVVGDGGP
jgi:CHAT domain-containing protein